jgi:hypothetical protein
MTKLVCSVDTCAHNSDHYCCKNSIKVDGERAEAPASTCCASFDEKNGTCYCNSSESPSESLEISCDAANCMYNKAQKCTAANIGIAGSGAKKMEQTECATFRRA